MTEEQVAERDIIVRTPGLSAEELAAVVSVVRATIQEQAGEEDCGDEVAARPGRRWRRAVLDAPQSDRAWR